jgi:putative transposase
VAAHRAEFGVATLCGAINLPVSTFYDRSSRPPSARAQADSELAERIEKIWTDSGRTYGSPRVHAQLARDGVYVGRKRVERIMAGHGWRGAYLRRGWQTTTRRDCAHAGAGVPDLVDRDFTADAPNRLWVADLTYLRTLQGFFYLLLTWNQTAGWIITDRHRHHVVRGPVARERRGEVARPGTVRTSRRVARHLDQLGPGAADDRRVCARAGGVSAGLWA